MKTYTNNLIGSDDLVAINGLHSSERLLSLFF